VPASGAGIPADAAIRLLIAHRDQSTSSLSRLVSGLQNRPLEGLRAAPSQACHPVDPAARSALLPLRGQRRLQTGFPIIRPTRVNRHLVIAYIRPRRHGNTIVCDTERRPPQNLVAQCSG